MGLDSEQELLKESSSLRVGEGLTGKQVPSCFLCSPHQSVGPSISISLLVSINQDHHPPELQEKDSTEASLALSFGSLSLVFSSAPLYLTTEVR